MKGCQARQAFSTSTAFRTCTLTQSLLQLPSQFPLSNWAPSSPTPDPPPTGSCLLSILAGPMQWSRQTCSMGLV